MLAFDTTMQPAHQIYRIKIKGTLSVTWSQQFDGLRIEHDGGNSILYGAIVDQAALHGLLARIRDLGLPLLLVEKIEASKKENQA